MKLMKRGRFYHYRFMVRGKLYRGSTELENLRDAQTAAAEIRKQIVLGNLSVLERGPASPLKEFLKKSFLPYVESEHKLKPKTLEYYRYGAAQLSASTISEVNLNEIRESIPASLRRELIRVSELCAELWHLLMNGRGLAESQ